MVKRTVTCRAHEKTLSAIVLTARPEWLVQPVQFVWLRLAGRCDHFVWPFDVHPVITSATDKLTH